MAEGQMRWGLLRGTISTGFLVVLNESRKREARADLQAVKRESREVVARQDDTPFVGSAGKLQPEHRFADTASRLDSIEAGLVPHLLQFAQGQKMGVASFLPRFPSCSSSCA